MKKESKPRIAIAVDQLTNLGGGEKVLMQLLKLYPDATVYTSIADKEFVKKEFKKAKIKTSFIQRIPFEKYFRKELLVFYPLAYRLFSFYGYDAVISVCTAFSKFVSPWSSKTKHINFCQTPPKFLWMKEGRTITESDKLSYKVYSFFTGTILEKIWQKWDRNAARNADVTISISKEVQRRVKKFYDLESEVIYPPVEVEDIPFNKDSSTRENWFLYLGRVERYKGVHLAIAACAEAHLPLKIAGAGTNMDEMREYVNEINAKGVVKFLGYPDEKQKRELLQKCKALLFPVKDEDFGIVPVEANAAGAAVIALRSGGVTETISEDNPKTGLFFKEWDAFDLEKTLKKFDITDYDPFNCRKQAEQFSSSIFRYKMKNLVEDTLKTK